MAASLFARSDRVNAHFLSLATMCLIIFGNRANHNLRLKFMFDKKLRDHRALLAKPAFDQWKML